VSPRTYLRLLRFSETFEDLHASGSLAGHAAEHGFADQAHMSREFRSMAGSPASAARKTAVGPFLDNPETQASPS
jgi:AraC-like DNA-binding protein